MDHRGFSHLLADIYRPFHKEDATIPATKNVLPVKQNYLEPAIFGTAENINVQANQLD